MSSLCKTSECDKGAIYSNAFNKTKQKYGGEIKHFNGDQEKKMTKTFCYKKSNPIKMKQEPVKNCFVPPSCD